MSKDQIVKPAVITGVAAAAANTTQIRISLLSHPRPLNETSLRILDAIHSSRSYVPCEDNSEVGSPVFREVRL